MRVLMQCYEYPPLGGGGAKVVFGLSKYLVECGYEVDVVTMKFRGLQNNEKIHGVNILRIPCLRTRESICYTLEMATYVFMAVPAILRLVKSKSYDFNHTHFVFPDGLISYIVKKMTGLPYIITCHGSDVPGYNPDRFTYQHKLLFPIWKKIVQSATLIVTPSETLQRLVLSHCPTVPVTSIPAGFDPDKFLPDREKKNRILVVSRMFERKGVQYFLKALEEIDGECPYEINIVGEGPYLPQLRQLGDKLRTTVTFWGHLDNNSEALKQLYETSRIFVFTSESENFPTVLMEAMAAGNAIISTKGTGCAEVIGDAGLLVPVKDSHAIKEKLELLMEDSDLCKKMGKAARKRLEGHFTWKKVTQQYQDLYQKTFS